MTQKQRLGGNEGVNHIMILDYSIQGRETANKKISDGKRKKQEAGVAGVKGGSRMMVGNQVFQVALGQIR